MSPIELAPRADLQNLLDAALAVGGETSTFDFKEVLDVRRDDHSIRLARAVGAFTNTDTGGYVWIGISDSREIKGLTDEILAQYDQTRIQKLLNRFLSPPPNVQVRRCERDGKNLVAIEVSPFKDVPSVVKASLSAGRDDLTAGTFLFRNGAAESAVLQAEGDVRRLCDAIVARRASAFVELTRKGLVGTRPEASAPQPQPVGAAAEVRLSALRDRAQRYWSAAPGQPPFIQVSFAPAVDLRLGREDLRGLIPRACVPGRHGFPPHFVRGAEIYSLQPQGYFGAIPFSEEPNPELHPSYLWLLDRSGAFFYREHFWEDDERSVIPGGVGLIHVVGNLIRLVRFLDRFGLALPEVVTDSSEFLLSVWLNNVKDRYLEDERGPAPLSPRRRTIPEPRVEAQLTSSLGAVRSARADMVVNLLEDIVWQCRRDDWPRSKLVDAIRSTPRFLVDGGEYVFPASESVSPPPA